MHVVGFIIRSAPQQTAHIFQANLLQFGNSLWCWITTKSSLSELQLSNITYIWYGPVTCHLQLVLHAHAQICIPLPFLLCLLAPIIPPGTELCSSAPMTCVCTKCTLLWLFYFFNCIFPFILLLEECDKWKTSTSPTTITTTHCPPPKSFLHYRTFLVIQLPNGPI